MKDQAWQLLLEYLWAPIIGAIGFVWAHLHTVDKRVTECETQIETIVTAVDEARTSRKEILNKVDATRVEATTQVETIRKEQREDFKEIRDLIATIGK